VAAHVDAAPQRGVLPRGAAPGAAHLAGAHEDLDVVELAEDIRERVPRQRRPVPRLLPLAAAAAATVAARRGGGRRRRRGTRLELGRAWVWGIHAWVGSGHAREGGRRRQARRR
jgi:hypothetical protein